MKIAIPYAKTHLEAEIADNCLAGVYTSALPEPEMSGAEYVRAAMDNPVSSPRLEDLAAGKKNVVVISSDHTRPYRAGSLCRRFSPASGKASRTST